MYGLSGRSLKGVQSFHGNIRAFNQLPHISDTLCNCYHIYNMNVMYVILVTFVLSGIECYRAQLSQGIIPGQYNKNDGRTPLDDLLACGSPFSHPPPGCLHPMLILVEGMCVDTMTVCVCVCVCFTFIFCVCVCACFNFIFSVCFYYLTC